MIIVLDKDQIVLKSFAAFLVATIGLLINEIATSNRFILHFTRVRLVFDTIEGWYRKSVSALQFSEVSGLHVEDEQRYILLVSFICISLTLPGLRFDLWYSGATS